MYEELPGYDAWKTAPPPEAPWLDTYCGACGEQFDAEEELQEGDECPNCGAPNLDEVEPDEPCMCRGVACYC